jgi:hypothetical protein
MYRLIGLCTLNMGAFLTLFYTAVLSGTSVTSAGGDAAHGIAGVLTSVPEVLSVISNQKPDIGKRQLEEWPSWYVTKHCTGKRRRGEGFAQGGGPTPLERLKGALCGC